jgi:hypothetical protein
MLQGIQHNNGYSFFRKWTLEEIPGPRETTMTTASGDPPQSAPNSQSVNRMKSPALKNQSTATSKPPMVVQLIGAQNIDLDLQIGKKEKTPMIPSIVNNVMTQAPSQPAASNRMTTPQLIAAQKIMKQSSIPTTTIVRSIPTQSTRSQLTAKQSATIVSTTTVPKQQWPDKSSAPVVATTIQPATAVPLLPGPGTGRPKRIRMLPPAPTAVVTLMVASATSAATTAETPVTTAAPATAATAAPAAAATSATAVDRADPATPAIQGRATAATARTLRATAVPLAVSTFWPTAAPYTAAPPAAQQQHVTNRAALQPLTVAIGTPQTTTAKGTRAPQPPTAVTGTPQLPTAATGAPQPPTTAIGVPQPPTAYPGAPTVAPQQKTGYPGAPQPPTSGVPQPPTAYPGAPTVAAQQRTAYPGAPTVAAQQITAYPGAPTSAPQQQTAYPGAPPHLPGVLDLNGTTERYCHSLYAVRIKKTLFT